MAIEALADTWKGFVEINADLSGVPRGLGDRELLVAFIEERTSNSVRNGLATEVTFSFPNPHSLVVLDNGMGPKNGRPGLGTKLLDASSKSWSLTPREQGGSRLSVNLKPT